MMRVLRDDTHPQAQKGTMRTQEPTMTDTDVSSHHKTEDAHTHTHTNIPSVWLVMTQRVATC